jgi:alpha-aminoadipate carrier protein LysW
LHIFFFRIIFAQLFKLFKDFKMTECPICGAEIKRAADTVVGELLECPDCGTELEVINLEPFEVEEAPQEEEDWGE